MAAPDLILQSVCLGGNLSKRVSKAGNIKYALSGDDETLDRLTSAGLSARVTDRIPIPFGRVLRSRLAWLRQRGLPADDMVEELVIIRAQQA